MPPDMFEMTGGQPERNDEPEDVFGYGAGFGDDDVFTEGKGTPPDCVEQGTPPSTQDDSAGFSAPCMPRGAALVQQDRVMREAPPPKRRRIRGKTTPACGA